MSWCHGDEVLTRRVARAWPIETLSGMIGKKPEAIKARFPHAGKPLTVTAGLIELIRILLPGRRLAAVGALLDMTPEEVAAVCNDFDLLADYDESGHGAGRHQGLFVQAERDAIVRMRKADVTYADIALSLSRTEESVKTEAKRIRDGVTPRGQGVADNREWRPGWSDEEVTLLMQLYGTMTAAEIGAQLGRSAKAVRRKCEGLALGN